VTDRFGLPAAKVSYRLSENSRRLMAFQAERARESLEAAGAWRVDVTPHPSNGHTMGTARMGDDPATSVVNRWNVAHEIPNLLIVDGSVFVTAGSANPTSTIVALALRAADHLVANRRNVPTPVSRRAGGGFPPVAVASHPPDHSPAPVIVSMEPGWLAPRERDRLASLAEAWIPAVDGMPAASLVEGFSDFVRRVRELRPDLEAEFRRGLVVADEELGLDDAARRAVQYVIAAAYYLSPEVRRRLDYEPEPATPVAARGFPEYVDEGLLDRVLALKDV
jgi:hypothetical protein